MAQDLDGPGTGLFWNQACNWGLAISMRQTVAVGEKARRGTEFLGTSTCELRTAVRYSQAEGAGKGHRLTFWSLLKPVHKS